MTWEFERLLSDIQQEIEDNKKSFRIENRVKNHIIVPVLAQLSWEGHKVKVVQREKSTKDRGRVDLALCDNNGDSKVVIEVKKLGSGDTEKAKKQAWDYAVAESIPLVVVTDGKTWSFYLLAEEGSYEDRCFYKLDLSESSPQESCRILSEYLARSNVITGKAVNAAEGVLLEKKTRKEARRTIPDAWTRILQRKKNHPVLKQLIEELANEVKDDVGAPPDDDDIIDFLRSLQRRERQVPAPPMPVPMIKTSAVPQPESEKQASAPPMPAPETKTSAAPQPESEKQASAPPMPAPETKTSAAPKPESERQASAPPMPAPETKTSAVPQPESEKQASATPMPVPMTKTSAVPQPESEKQASAPPMPAPETKTSAAPQPESERQASAPPMPAPKTKTSAAPQPESGGQDSASPMPAPETETSAAPQPELERQASAPPMPAPKTKTSAVPQPESGRQASAPQPSGASGSRELIILGRSYPYGSQSEAMAIVFKKLQEEKPDFLRRFYELPQNKNFMGRHRYLGRNKQELFGDNVENYRPHEPIDEDWVISTDYNRWPSKKDIIKLATRVAGLEFGKDIILNFDD